MDPLTAVDDSAESKFALALDLLTPLARQDIAHPNAPALTDSYYLVHDGSMTWADIPGQPQYAGIHVRRDVDAGTFRLDYSRQPIAALAQRWLIDQGADPAGILVTDLDGPKAADGATVRLEERLRRSGDRFQVTDSHTSDLVLDPDKESGVTSGLQWEARLQYVFETWIVARDARPEPGQHPYRVFFEEVDMRGQTYTLREGGFDSLDAARSWTKDTTQPLPAVSNSPSARAAAAGRRGTDAVVRSAGPPAAPPGTGPASPGRRPAR